MSGDCHTLSNFFFGKPWGLFVAQHDQVLNTSSIKKTSNVISEKSKRATTIIKMVE